MNQELRKALLAQDSNHRLYPGECEKAGYTVEDKSETETEDGLVTSYWTKAGALPETKECVKDCAKKCSYLADCTTGECCGYFSSKPNSNSHAT